VLAEGVETQMQLDFLDHEGCEEVQGYYFARPVSATRVREFLASGRLWALRQQEAISESPAA
jgi:EAL domain-containing protein (putative c-di-GMP-specific phosphodiesterase class I)